MNRERDSADQSPTVPVSRRRAVRLEAPAGLTVTLSDERISSKVIDIGLGGLGLLTNLPLPSAATYGVTLRFGTRTVMCDARTAHCCQREDSAWLVGMAFVRDDRIAAVEQFVDELTARQIEFPWPTVGH